jgi:hypothetical protein
VGNSSGKNVGRKKNFGANSVRNIFFIELGYFVKKLLVMRTSLMICLRRLTGKIQLA